MGNQPSWVGGVPRLMGGPDLNGHVNDVLLREKNECAEVSHEHESLRSGDLLLLKKRR